MNLPAFVGISILLAMTPGPDFALVTRNALQHGRRGAIETSIGFVLGVAVWTVACCVGIAALVRDAPGLFLTFKIVGAAYLAYLGISALWPRHGADTTLHVGGLASARSAIWLQGFTSTSLNPKLGVFFVVLFPEFIDKTKSVVAQSALLGAIYGVVELVWMVGYGMTVAAVGEALLSDKVRLWLQRSCGVVLLFFAVLLITSSSH